MYKKKTIDEFLEKLSSSDSMPGGGVASALVAANGTSLGLMVCNLSLGKEKYKKNEALIQEVKEKLEVYKKEFLFLMDKDAEMFKAMENVYLMPKNTNEEKETREEAMQKACKKCCETPETIMIKAIEALQLIDSLKGKSNESVASDLEIGSIFLKAAMAGAWDNILINLKYIKDEEFVKKYEYFGKQFV